MASYNLGSSEDPAEYHLVIDLQERKAFIASNKEAEKVLAGNFEPEATQGELISLSTEDFETLLQTFVEQSKILPTMNDLRVRMEEENKTVVALNQWLDELIK